MPDIFSSIEPQHLGVSHQASALRADPANEAVVYSVNVDIHRRRFLRGGGHVTITQRWNSAIYVCSVDFDEMVGIVDLINPRRDAISLIGTTNKDCATRGEQWRIGKPVRRI